MKLLNLPRLPWKAKEFAGQALALFLLLGIGTPGLAQGAYLAAGQPDGLLLLAPPPASGSAEETADLASARAVFHARTPADEARALNSAGLAFSLFTPAIGSFFDPDRLPKTKGLLLRVRRECSGVIDPAKNHWKRLRPYELDPKLSLKEPEASFGYPSGHSTRGTVYALVLAELFPEKRDALLAIGRQIGWDRVIIAKHFPTDIYAGRVLGQAILRELLASPQFQSDLATAKEEVQAAQRAAHQGTPAAVGAHAN